jgi:deoxyribose-phosphate aldolase
MDVKNILSKCDHTLLTQTATWADMQKICDDGMRYQTASVCIPPCYVEQAKKYVGDKLKICTVIGFPNGYNTTAVKVFETEQAILEGYSYPEIAGVGIVCHGGDSYVVKNEIVSLVSSAFNISANKIFVAGT